MTSEKNMVVQTSVKKNLFNSAIATGIAEFVTLPACTIKTNYQNTNSLSITKTTKEIYGKYGVRGFYSASFPAISSQIISTSSKYVFYRYLEDQQFQYSNKVLNGIASGVTSSLITHPIDVIKIHWQMNDPLAPKLKENGIKLMYRGYSKTFSKVCLASSLFLPIFDYCKQITDSAFLASACSAVISTSVMHPVDFLKTRHVYGKQLFIGWNPLLYYKGISINLLRIVPHFVIVMTTIEYLNKF